ncbi:MAG: hypothetical protein QOH66_51, partial [Actinomycetota bacterium]|nr:hypothetical protein [Actinomycetota bacterium]
MISCMTQLAKNGSAGAAAAAHFEEQGRGLRPRRGGIELDAV